MRHWFVLASLVFVSASCVDLGGLAGSIDGGGSGSGESLKGDAAFDFMCNGAVIAAVVCPSKRWSYDYNACPKSGLDGDSGNGSFSAIGVLRNRGPYPIAFLARPGWLQGNKYVPGQPNDPTPGFNGLSELYGTIAPGESFDFSKAFVGGTFVIVASVRPFAQDAETSPLIDEGTIPWPTGKLGSFTTTTLYVAQLAFGPLNNPCLGTFAKFF